LAARSKSMSALTTPKQKPDTLWPRLSGSSNNTGGGQGAPAICTLLHPIVLDEVADEPDFVASDERGELLRVKYLPCPDFCSVDQWRMGGSQGGQRTPAALLRAQRAGRTGVRVQRDHEELACALRAGRGYRTRQGKSGGARTSVLEACPTFGTAAAHVEGVPLAVVSLATTRCLPPFQSDPACNSVQGSTRRMAILACVVTRNL